MKFRINFLQIKYINWIFQKEVNGDKSISYWRYS